MLGWAVSGAALRLVRGTIAAPTAAEPQQSDIVTSYDAKDDGKIGRAE